MAKRKEPRIRHKSEPAITVKEVEIEALEQWLRIVDKPLALEKKNGRNDAIPTCGISRAAVGCEGLRQ